MVGRLERRINARGRTPRLPVLGPTSPSSIFCQCNPHHFLLPVAVCIIGTVGVLLRVKAVAPSPFSLVAQRYIFSVCRLSLVCVSFKSCGVCRLSLVAQRYIFSVCRLRLCGVCRLRFCGVCRLRFCGVCRLSLVADRYIFSVRRLSFCGVCHLSLVADRYIFSVRRCSLRSCG